MNKKTQTGPSAHIFLSLSFLYQKGNPISNENWSVNPLFPTTVWIFLFGYFTLSKLNLHQPRPSWQTGLPSLLALSWLLPRIPLHSKAPTLSFRATGHWLPVFPLGLILQTTCCWTQLFKATLLSACFPRDQNLRCRNSHPAGRSYTWESGPGEHTLDSSIGQQVLKNKPRGTKPSQ